MSDGLLQWWRLFQRISIFSSCPKSLFTFSYPHASPARAGWGDAANRHSYWYCPGNLNLSLGVDSMKSLPVSGMWSQTNRSVTVVFLSSAPRSISPYSTVCLFCWDAQNRMSGPEPQICSQGQDQFKILRAFSKYASLHLTFISSSGHLSRWSMQNKDLPCAT